jgi:hypothetical protein
MALVDCNECSSKISDKASACPKCGHPVQPFGAPPPPALQAHGVSHSPAPQSPYQQAQLSQASGQVLPQTSPQQAVGTFGVASPRQPAKQVSGGVVALVIGGAALIVLAVVAVTMVLPSNTPSSRPPDLAAPVTPTVSPEENDRRQLAANPDPLLEESEVGIFDKGIVSDYRELISVSVLNKSHVAVHNLSGIVEWLDDSGRTFGVTPFSLKGSIVAGDTKGFSKEVGTLTTGGTVQAAATKARLTFTHAQPVN